MRRAVRVQAACVNGAHIRDREPAPFEAVRYGPSFPAQFAIPEGTADLIKSHGSGPTPICSRRLFNCPTMKEATTLFHPAGNPNRRDSIPVASRARERSW